MWNAYIAMENSERRKCMGRDGTVVCKRLKDMRKQHAIAHTTTHITHTIHMVYATASHVQVH